MRSLEYTVPPGSNACDIIIHAVLSEKGRCFWGNLLNEALATLDYNSLLWASFSSIPGRSTFRNSSIGHSSMRLETSLGAVTMCSICCIASFKGVDCSVSGFALELHPSSLTLPSVLCITWAAESSFGGMLFHLLRQYRLCAISLQTTWAFFHQFQKQSSAFLCVFFDLKRFCFSWQSTPSFGPFLHLKN